MKAAAMILVLVLMLLIAMSSDVSGCRAKHDGSRCPDGNRTLSAEASKLDGSEHRVGGGAKMTKGDDDDVNTESVRERR